MSLVELIGTHVPLVEAESALLDTNRIAGNLTDLRGLIRIVGLEEECGMDEVRIVLERFNLRLASCVKTGCDSRGRAQIDSDNSSHRFRRRRIRYLQ